MPPAIEDYDIGFQEKLYPYGLDEPEASTSFQARPIHVTKREAQSPFGAAHLPFLDRLKALSEIRQIPWRPGQELPPERSIDSPRVQQRGAVLLVTRGKIVKEQCTHCAAGYGRFSVCVTMENWFQGACSGCIYTSKGNKCSLRFQTSGNVDGRALRHHISNPDMIKELVSTAKANPSNKRKRRYAPTMAQAISNASFSGSTQQIASPLPKSPDMDAKLPSEVACDESSGQFEYVETRVKKQKKQCDPSNSALPGLQSWPVKTQEIGESQHPSDTRCLPPEPETITQHATQPSKKAWGVSSTVKEPHAFTPVSATQQEHSGNAKATSTPIIDSLPKPKQRHIYSLISGLQGGIDHLEKQLSSLKALLGIEDDDNTSPH